MMATPLALRKPCGERAWATSAVFYATIGTGIGTGIVFDRCTYRGRTGAAAEGGHAVIDYSGPYVCACGKKGCVEAIASGPAIARRARSKVTADPARGKVLLEMANGEINCLTSEVVGRAWRGGDPMAAEVLQETAYVLTIWLGSTIDLLEPDINCGGRRRGRIDVKLLRTYFRETAPSLYQPEMWRDSIKAGAVR